MNESIEYIKKKHSALGILSFIFSLCGIAFIFLSLVLVFVLEGMNEDLYYFIIGMIGIFGAACSLSSIGIAISAFFSKVHSMVLPIIACMINILFIGIVISLTVLGQEE